MVVNKPPLLPTMGVSEDQNSLIKVAKEYIKLKYEKPGNVYLGVVSRLDSHTSGLVVLARTSKAAERLNRQFQAKKVGKRYLAIVPTGAPSHGLWSDHLWKNESLHRMETVDENRDEPHQTKLAQLEFWKLAADKKTGFDLMDVRLLTGRKHQIRVQFSSRGLPIAGDRKYNSRLKFEQGIGLHSGFVCFTHPTLQRLLKFSVEPPNYWPFKRVISSHLEKLVQTDWTREKID